MSGKETTIADVQGKIAVSAEVARHLVDPPLSRNTIYSMVARGEIESVRVGGDAEGRGGRILIPVRPLLERFGIDASRKAD